MKKLILTACTLLTLLGKAQLTSSLVICMPMDGNANDFSGNSNNGTLNGVVTPTVGHTGAPGTAYNFNNSYIEILGSTSINNIDLTSELSVSVWCKINGWAPSPGYNFPVIEHYKTVGDNGWQWNLFDPSTGATDGFAYSLAGLGVFNSNPPYTAGAWNHFALVYSLSTNTCKYYINGALVYTSSTALTALLNSSNGPLRIGFSQAGNDEKATGDMDNLRVYNRVLTPGEVAYLSTHDPECADASVITDPPPTGCCLGNSCGKTSNPLGGSYEIPMQSFNFNYTMPQSSGSEVMIGYPNCTTGTARLDVKDDHYGNGIKGYSSTNTMRNIGVYGIGVTPGDGEKGRTGIGVLGETNAVISDGYAAGVAGFGGGTAVLTALPPGVDVGVYGNATAHRADWAGYFDGDVNINWAGGSGAGGPYALIINGSAWNSANLWTGSDKRFKENIKSLENVSDKLKKLNGYTYTFKKDDEFKRLNFPDKEQIGLIAQELKEVFPQLVNEGKDGYLAVNYQGMVPVLLQNAKEQQTQIECQQKQIDELKALVNSLAGNTATDSKTGMNTSVPVTLSDKNVVVLNQNVPNPFAESTVITYNVPSDFSKAQIIFTTENGSVIKTIDVKEKGAGTLNVFANDLSHGVYSYTLVIDGKIVATKKMIKE